MQVCFSAGDMERTWLGARSRAWGLLVVAVRKVKVWARSKWTAGR